MKNRNIFIHPLYFALMLFYVIIGKGAIFVAFFVCAIMHELAHAKAAERLGYSMRRIALMPYGAVLYRLESLPSRASVKIAIAGPLMNIALSVVTVAVWWLIPELYIITKPFFLANMSLAIVNLIPCYPLDGSRVWIGFAKNKLRAVKVTKLFSVAMGLAMIGFGIASIWYTFNVTIMVMGGYLIVSTCIGGEREAYEHITSVLPWVKDYSRGVIAKEIFMSGDSTLMQVLRLLDRFSVIELVVMMGGMEIKRIKECELKILFERERLDIKLSELCRGMV